MTAIIRYIHRHHIALLALFIASTGTAYAAGLPKNSVGTKQLKNNAVTAAKIATNAVASAELKASSVTTAKLANGAVTSAKLSDGAVTNGKLAADLSSKLGNPLVVILARDGVQNIPNSPGFSGVASSELVSFNKEVVDTGGFFNPATPTQVTVPNTGLYRIAYGVKFSEGGGAGFYASELTPGGQNTLSDYALPGDYGGAWDATMNASGLVSLSAGDTIKLRVGQTTSPGNIGAHADMSVEYVGPAS